MEDFILKASRTRSSNAEMIDSLFPDQRRSEYESKWRVVLSILLFCVFADLLIDSDGSSVNSDPSSLVREAKITWRSS